MGKSGGEVVVAESAGGGGGAATGEANEPSRPALHIGVYGEPHVGKSWFVARVILALVAAGAPAVYVAFFDRRGKHLTYERVWRKAGTVTTKEGVDKRGTPWVDYYLDGRKLARVGFYAVANVEETDGPARLAEFFPVFETELVAGKWGGFVLDSLSFLAYDARKQSQYVDNPTTSKGSKQHGMQWYGAATDVAEDFLCSRIPNLTCATVVVMHESKALVEAEGTVVRSPFVPGKRLKDSNMIAATFPELYRLYVERAEDGRKLRRLQTDTDEHWQAGSVIGAPDGSKPEYEALWATWEK